MEKVKDFLYDISDLFFSLLIIGIIFFVVSWKLTDTMSESWFSNISQDDIESIQFPDATTPDDVIVIPVEETPITEVEETPATDPVDVIVEIKDITFEVVSGSSGYQIATNLKADGLIQDVDAFIQKLGDMQLGNKLRAGKFKLNTGMTMEDIINKLAGQ